MVVAIVLVGYPLPNADDERPIPVLRLRSCFVQQNAVLLHARPTPRPDQQLTEKTLTRTLPRAVV